MKSSDGISKNGLSMTEMRVVITALLLALTMTLSAQEPFKGKFTNVELRIDCTLNLYADSIDVPGLEGLEKCYGYISGKLNGNWIILRVDKITDDTAVARITCDRGNDATDITFRTTPTGIQFTQADAVIKTVNGNKYVKLPKKTIELKKIK
ncbi:MAG: hypothetical protein MJY59_02620 [Bacteroidaceae bacterium]|nr:hypothetical protein [Bacteroidaceae bacterium]